MATKKAAAKKAPAKKVVKVAASKKKMPKGNPMQGFGM